MTKKNSILLGYEQGTGKEISITPNHLVVCGVTQESGKTTTLEALIYRSKLKAVGFKTKPGEKGFSQGTKLPPFFKENFDWEYALDILQAETQSKMKFETSWIIDASKNASNLLEFKRNIDNALANGEINGRKINELSRSVYTTLQAYLDKVLPSLQYSGLSKTLDTQDGLNIIDLERYKPTVQSLLIRSVLVEVLQNKTNTVVIIPEAWKYAPQQYGNPCKRPIEEFIRQGATNGNLLWMDSQDITGIDKTPLKQMSTWILGYQSEINEIKRTLDQIPVPKTSKPKPEQIATLKTGFFYIITKDFTKLVYVLPAWLDEETGIKIAKGKMDISEVSRPEQIAPFTVSKPYKNESLQVDSQQTNSALSSQLAELRKEIAEVREDFFNTINEFQQSVPDILNEFKKQIQPEPINTDEIVSKVLQKLPTQKPILGSTAIDEEALIRKILSRIPTGGGTTYTVSPLEKIKKRFLEEAKNKILTEVSSLNAEEKKIFLFAQTLGKNTNTSEVMEKVLHISPTGGSRNRIQEELNNLATLGFLRKDQATRFYGNLKEKITSTVEIHGATPQDIELLYNHILNDISEGGNQ